MWFCDYKIHGLCGFGYSAYLWSRIIREFNDIDTNEDSRETRNHKFKEVKKIVAILIKKYSEIARTV